MGKAPLPVAGPTQLSLLHPAHAGAADLESLSGAAAAKVHRDESAAGFPAPGGARSWPAGHYRSAFGTLPHDLARTLPGTQPSPSRADSRSLTLCVDLWHA